MARLLNFKDNYCIFIAFNSFSNEATKVFLNSFNIPSISVN